jgi:hypothetical protein
MEQRTDYPNVYRFIRGVFNRPPVPSKIELRHISDGRNGETQAQITSWESKEELNNPPDDIAKDIIVEAVDDAKNHPKGFTQTYAILVYRGTEEVYQARRIFNVKGRGNNFDTDDVIQESEPTNEKGMLALAMRNMDAAMSRLQQMSHQISTFYDRELERKRKEVEELQKSRFATYALIENMLDRKQERDLNLRREARMEDLKDKGIKKLEQFLPMFAGKVMPALLTNGASPELKKLGQETGIQLTIGSFFESLTKEQFKQILGILSQDEVIAFMELNSKRNAETALGFFNLLDKDRGNDIILKVLNENQRTIFMQAVKDIETEIKAAMSNNGKNGVEDEPS